MNTTQPIRSNEDLLRFKEYYKVVCPNSRNYLMIVVGLNTALRISDILKLRWGDIYDFEQEKYKEHLLITEQKTDKNSMILLNKSIKTALAEHKEYLHKQNKEVTAKNYLFENLKKPNQAVSRVQAFRIVKKAAQACHLEGVVSCHSLRKTFGYHAWKQGIEPALLMNIFNHSSFSNTARYLGIEQDERDQVFRDIEL